MENNTPAGSANAIFLSSLTHDNKFHQYMARAFYLTPCRNRTIRWYPRNTSLLAAGYNQAWTECINNLHEGYKWFAMLHADIIPEDYWLDKLIEQAEKYDADVMSAVVPIKDHHGVSSTAVSSAPLRLDRLHDPYNRFSRLTQHEVNRILPETFDINDVHNIYPLPPRPDPMAYLLVNTGCFIARIDRPWCPLVHFTINDQIRQVFGGKLVSVVEPEDWYFSRRVYEVGGKVMATRAVKVQHIGERSYHSVDVWGKETDILEQTPRVIVAGDGN